MSGGKDDGDEDGFVSSIARTRRRRRDEVDGREYLACLNHWYHGRLDSQVKFYVIEEEDDA